MKTNAIIGMSTFVVALLVSVSLTNVVGYGVVKASQETDYFEITSQAYGNSGWGRTSVKMTREQYQDFKQDLVEFRVRLNQTTSQEETNILFNDLLHKLQTIGLVSTSINLGQFQNSNLDRRINQVSLQKLKTLTDDVDSNYLCKITGQFHVGEILFENPIVYATYLLSFFFHVIHTLIGALVRLNILIPLSLNQRIGLGGYYPDAPGSSPAQGWLFTQGTLGAKNWSGNIKGALNRIMLPADGEEIYYPAVSGFTGIKLFDAQTKTIFFVGTAICVKVTLEN